MVYRYMYVEDVENILFNDYYSDLYVSDDKYNIPKDFVIPPGLGIEKKIVKFHFFNKLFFVYLHHNKIYGERDSVYGNLAINHFIYVMTYADNGEFPFLDNDYNIIAYLKEKDVADYCDDADIIYSFENVRRLSFEQRLNLFFKYY